MRSSRRSLFDGLRFLLANHLLDTRMVAFYRLDPLFERRHFLADAIEEVVSADGADKLEAPFEVGGQFFIRTKRSQVIAESLVLFVELEDGRGILDRRFDFALAVQDAVRGHEAFDVRRAVAGYFCDVEIVEGFAKRFPLAINGRPAQTPLEDRAGHHREIVGETRFCDTCMISAYRHIRFAP